MDQVKPPTNFFKTMSMEGSSWADDDNDDHFHQPIPAARGASEDDLRQRTQSTDSAEDPVEAQEHKERRASFDRPSGPTNPIPENAPFTCYVGNLPYEISEAELDQFFSPLPIVHIRIPYDHYTKKPRGCAYVEFENKESLVQALELNAMEIHGRKIRVDVAAQRKPRQGYGQRFNRSQTSETPSSDAAPTERRKLKLLPRTKSKEEESSTGASNRSIFGDAKPRDESAYLSRKKSEELERKASMDAADPAVETQDKPETPEDEQTPEKERSHRRESRDFGSRGGRRGRGRGRDFGRDRTNSYDKKSYKHQPKKTEDILKSATVKVEVKQTKTANIFAAFGDSDSESTSDEE